MEEYLEYLKDFKKYNFLLFFHCQFCLGIYRNFNGKLQIMAGCAIHKLLFGPVKLSITIFKCNCNWMDCLPIKRQRKGILNRK